LIPELSHFVLILAFCVALTQAVIPMLGAMRGSDAQMIYGRNAARMQSALVAVAFFGLMWSFYKNDFSVLYVASHSNSMLPLRYRLSAVWGGHEGSILLWLLILGAWSAAVAQFGGNLPQVLLARVLSVMGMIASGLMAFVLLTSNPFERLIPPAIDGNDLNPLLQDPGMVIHPPMLYIGYVGFSVVFSFAVAALIEGRFESAWARWARPWTLAAWSFLSIGIALGSYWAYYELGWGGWWFWDPVENASFMPWLVGTALVHSLMVSDKRDGLKAWTLLLALIAFSLSLLGTFLVRSGVLTSVHAFATDPRRGIFILALLAVVTGSSLALFAWRAPLMVQKSRFPAFSREGMILIGNVLLMVAAATVLLGTLYPLVLDALDLGKISVGPPYFEAVFVPLMVPVVLLSGFATVSSWRALQWRELRRPLAGLLLVGVAAVVTLTLLHGGWRPMAALGFFTAAWMAAAGLSQLHVQLRDYKQLKPASIGMLVAHIGVAVFIIGVTSVKSFEKVDEMRMQVGDEHTISGYRFRLMSLNDITGPNYSGTRGDFAVSKEGKVFHLFPEKRFYNVQQMPMTESAISNGLTRDLYIALGEPIDNTSWGVRIQVKPFVDWIWFGCLLMAIGGFSAAADRRYRQSRLPINDPEKITNAVRIAESAVR
jgi:cytochrome c-type biogenesis protein CcmF